MFTQTLSQINLFKSNFNTLLRRFINQVTLIHLFMIEKQEEVFKIDLTPSVEKWNKQNPNSRQKTQNDSLIKRETLYNLKKGKISNTLLKLIRFAESIGCKVDDLIYKKDGK